jgi:hypothetical protein
MAQWSLAKLSDGGGEASGGVAILVREGIGIKGAEELISPTHRVVGAKVNVPGGRQILVVSAYFRCSIGMTKDNLDLMATIGAGFDDWRGEAALGADFNAPPEEVAALGGAALSQMQIIAPTAPRGTCAGTTVS